MSDKLEIKGVQDVTQEASCVTLFNKASIENIEITHSFEQAIPQQAFENYGPQDPQVTFSIEQFDNACSCSSLLEQTDYPMEHDALGLSLLCSGIEEARTYFDGPENAAVPPAPKLEVEASKPQWTPPSLTPGMSA